jgi:hypothetical protein
MDERDSVRAHGADQLDNIVVSDARGTPSALLLDRAAGSRQAEPIETAAPTERPATWPARLRLAAVSSESINGAALRSSASTATSRDRPGRCAVLNRGTENQTVSSRHCLPRSRIRLGPLRRVISRRQVHRKRSLILPECNPGRHAGDDKERRGSRPRQRRTSVAVAVARRSICCVIA